MKKRLLGYILIITCQLSFSQNLTISNRWNILENMSRNILSENIISLSKKGIISDADLSLGSSNFGTDQTSIIQTILNNASANNPIVIYWDVRVSVNGLKVKSYTTIVALPGCGAILRDASNVSLLTNYNATPGTISDHDINIYGGIWNANGYRGGTQKQAISTASGGMCTCIKMLGVRNCIFENITCYNSAWSGFQFHTCEDIVINNLKIDQGVSPVVFQGGLEIDGYEKNIKVNDIWVRSGDDAVALNSEFSTVAATGGDGPDYTLYYQHGGIINNIDIANVYLSSNGMGIRLLSGTRLIDNISIKNISGNCLYYWLIIDNYFQSPTAGPGNIGKVKIDDVQVSGGTGAYSIAGKAHINCNAERIEITNYKRGNYTDAFPSLYVGGSNSAIKNLLINYYSNDTLGTYDLNHIVVNAATIENLNVSGYAKAKKTNNSDALLRVQNSGTITHLNIKDLQAFNIKNIVNNTATITYINANNIFDKKSNNTDVTFYTTTTIADMVLSNYFGYNISSGTITKLRGDAVGDLPTYP